MEKNLIAFWQQSLIFLLGKTFNSNQKAITLVGSEELERGKIFIADPNIFFTNNSRQKILVAPFILSCGKYFKFPLFMQAEISNDLDLYAGLQPYPWCPYDFLEPYADTDFILGSQETINNAYSMLKPFDMTNISWQQQLAYGINFFKQATSNAWQNLASRYGLNIIHKAAIIWIDYLDLEENFLEDAKFHKTAISYLKTQNLTTILSNLKQELPVLAAKKIDAAMPIQDIVSENFTYEQKQIFLTCIHNAHKNLFVESVTLCGKTTLINLIIKALYGHLEKTEKLNIIHIEMSKLYLINIDNSEIIKKEISLHELPLMVDWLMVEHAELINPIIAFVLIKIAKRCLIFGNTSLSYPATIPSYLELHLLQVNNLLQNYDELAEYGLLLTSGNLARIAKDLFFNLQLTTRFGIEQTIISCYNNLHGYKCNEIINNKPVIVGIKIVSYHEQFLHSLKNQAEVEAIINWIKTHKDTLEEIFSNNLQNIITIVTPFYGQIQALKQALFVEQINLDVFFMQQARKRLSPITIVSTVYHKTDFSKLLFNQSTTMLKQILESTTTQIIIFGDLHVFSYAYNDPVSMFGKFIYHIETSEINSINDYSINHEFCL